MSFFINNKIAFYNSIPEIFFTIAILSQLLYNSSWRNSNSATHFELNKMVALQSFFILVCTFFLLLNCQYNAAFTNFLLSNDNSTNALKLILIFSSILALGPISQGFYLQKLNFFEFYTLYLFSILSSLLLISASDFLSVYLLIEMQALCFYILAASRKQSTFSIEAGLKYFIFGSVISCVFLFSLSLLYGAVGTLNFHDLNLIFSSFPFPSELNSLNTLVIFCILLISVTLLFKLGIAPFHFWVVDVYDGSPISSTVIFSFLPKLVLFNLFIKISFIFGDAFKEIDYIFIFCGILSVAVGAFLALTQDRLKRFLIYSSISQVGFPIVIIGTKNLDCASSVYFFILIYILTSIVMWSGYLFLYQFLGKSSSFSKEKLNSPIYLSDLTILFKLDKIWAFFFMLIFFSIAGLPPLSGFAAKFLVIFFLITNSNIISATLLLFITSIATFYYVRVIKIIFFENIKTKELNFNFSANNLGLIFNYNCFVAVFCLFLLIHSFFFFDSWLIFSKYIYYNIIF